MRDPLDEIMDTIEITAEAIDLVEAAKPAYVDNLAKSMKLAGEVWSEVFEDVDRQLIMNACEQWVRATFRNCHSK